MTYAITRRRCLATALGATAIALVGCGESASRRRSRIAYAAGFSLPKSVDEALWLAFEQRIEQAIPDMDLRLVIRGETGPEEALFAALRRNRIQIGGGSFAGVATVVPEISMLSVPFLFDTDAEVDFVMDEYMLPAFQKLFAAKGLEVLHWTEIGWVNVYAKPVIDRPEAARGVRLRSSSSLASQAFIAEIGGDTITMPFSEVLPALQTGLIDGGVTSVTMYSLSGLTTEAPNYVLTRHSYDMGVLLANKTWMNSLSPAEREVVRLGYGGAAATRTAARASVEGLLKSLPAKGVKLYEPTAEERAAWREATWPSHEKLIQKVGGQAREIYETMLQGKRDFAARHATP
ncbi:MAG TPA: TRAP transporter substrate-binding protein DctP [Steroidobacteraceae bacterium]|nr:TRAP transporter substrate-binding protein DctP [Steroidobacteraceae bacterium]HRX88871.1 TRAP transporter substrate-binding protein DctP [Steroidobacteraceae bacterium]